MREVFHLHSRIAWKINVWYLLSSKQRQSLLMSMATGTTLAGALLFMRVRYKPIVNCIFGTFVWARHRLPVSFDRLYGELRASLF